MARSARAPSLRWLTASWSDLVTDEKVREAHAHGRSVVIVDEHENVTVLPSPNPALGEREWDRFWRRILTHWDSI